MTEASDIKIDSPRSHALCPSLALPYVLVHSRTQSRNIKSSCVASVMLLVLLVAERETETAYAGKTEKIS